MWKELIFETKYGQIFDTNYQKKIPWITVFNTITQKFEKHIYWEFGNSRKHIWLGPQAQINWKVFQPPAATP